jgi:hypothetical protein
MFEYHGSNLTHNEGEQIKHQRDEESANMAIIISLPMGKHMLSIGNYICLKKIQIYE